MTTTTDEVTYLMLRRGKGKTRRTDVYMAARPPLGLPNTVVLKVSLRDGVVVGAEVAP